MRHSFTNLPKLVLLLGGTLLCAPNDIFAQSKPLVAVESLDLERYAGKWFEIARLPNRFEKDCVGVTAEYAFKRETKSFTELSVTNRCYKVDFDGKLSVANGRARAYKDSPNSKLKVSFVPWFFVFAGDYWVIELADDYRYAVVGEPGRKFLWILARQKSLAERDLQGILERLESKHGYNPDDLYFTPQQ
jgi:apolipoprotein D and lipocalin family protein